MASATSWNASAAHSAEPLLLATRSADKAREIIQILRAVTHREIRSLDQLGIAPDDDEDTIETEPTFLGNAIAKARYFLARTGLSVLADDSGIQVDALGGAPGVRSRRFAGSALSGLALDRANNDALLDAIRDVPPARRTARYVCAAVLLAPGHTAVAAIGSVSGHLLTAPRGDAGFGYDPLFLLRSLDRSFAEVDAATKHRFSHRGRAFRALAASGAIR